MATTTESSDASRSRRSRRSSVRPDYTIHGAADHSDREGDDFEYEPPVSGQRSPNQEGSSQQDAQSEIASARAAEIHQSPTRELSDPPDPHRPNKYHGPASTWKDWTAAERSIAQSLDRLKAKDLSVHLYNAYHFKLRAQRARSTTSGPDKRMEPDWEPPVNWTAWPMSAKNVPRQLQGYDKEAYRQSTLDPVDASRNDLRETLLAHITKIARERFTDRDCEDCDGKHSYESSTTARDMNIGQTTDLTTENEDSSERSRGTSSEATRSIKRSRSKGSASSSRSRKRRRGFDDGEQLEPVPMADDGTARTIAGPSVEHIISSLEKLLQGLHTTRQHYFDQTSRNQTRRTRQKRRRVKRKGATPHQRSDNFEDMSDPDSGSELDSGTTSDSIDSPPENRGKYETYGLRDWKDVLGLAAILGWDAEALQRTRDRCAVLFQDQMPMIPLGLDSRTPTNIMEDEKGKIISSEDEIEEGVHVDGFLRPLDRKQGWRGRNKGERKRKGVAKSAHKRPKDSNDASSLEDVEDEIRRIMNDTQDGRTASIK